MKRLSYSQLALDDLKSILDFIARDKPEAAVSFVDSLIERCRFLAEHPELGMQREDLAPALRLVTHRGYGIYYRNLTEDVMIERVLHPALDVGRQSFGELS